MIPTKNATIVTQGNLNGEKIGMGVHAASLQKLIGILTDLYSDPEAAIVREYSTNALDSHIAAGVTEPIQVSLPSPLSPFLRIRDFGLGMSVDDVRDIYSQYGASTKDTSNDFNGMLGLGSKSALTYCPQFTVVAIKGGVKATVVVSRAEDGTGTMEVADTVTTDERNGVEIVIPVKYGADFDTKARNFYRFWKPGTVLVNGKEPSLIEGNEVATDIYSVRGLDADYIVQGNVAYPVANRGLYQGSGYYRDFGVVAFVPNGSVTFAPSREALMYDDVTKREVARIEKAFGDGLAASIQSDIDASANAFEALKRWHGWKQTLSWNMPDNIKFNGHVLGAYFDGYFMTYDPHAYRFQTQGRRNLPYTDVLSGMVIVTDWTSDRPTAPQRNKLKAWAEENDVTADRFVLVAKKFGAPFTDDVETVSWDDVNKIKVNKPRANGGVRGPVAWKVYNGSYFVDNNDPEPESDVVYLSPTDKVDDYDLSAVLSHDSDLTIVKLSKNRWDKFVRQFPNAQHINDYVAEVVKGHTDMLTEDDRKALAFPYYLRSTYSQFDESRIDDPKVREVIALAKLPLTTPGIQHYQKMRNIAARFGIGLTEVKVVSPDDVLEGYSLVDVSNYRFSVNEHIYVYMNAWYNRSK